MACTTAGAKARSIWRRWISTASPVTPRERSSQTALLKTTPLHLTGEAITLNAEVATGGSIRASLLDSGGSPLDAFGFEDCVAITEGGLACDLRWRGQGLAELGVRNVQLVFEFQQAKLYALTSTADPASD